MTNAELKDYLDDMHEKMDDVIIEVTKLNTIKGILFAMATVILPFMLFFYTLISDNTVLIHKLEKQIIKTENNYELKL